MGLGTRLVLCQGSSGSPVTAQLTVSVEVRHRSAGALRDSPRSLQLAQNVRIRSDIWTRLLLGPFIRVVTNKPIVELVSECRT